MLGKRKLEIALSGHRERINCKRNTQDDFEDSQLKFLRADSKRKVSALHDFFAHAEELESQGIQKALELRAAEIEKKALSKLSVKNGVINLSLLSKIHPDIVRKAAKLALKDENVQDLNLSVSLCRRISITIFR